MIGFPPALIRERSSPMGRSACPGRLGRAEDLAEIDLLALGVVKAQERYLLLVRPFLERDRVTGSRERFVPLGHAKISGGEVRTAAENDRLTTRQETRRDLRSDGANRLVGVGHAVREPAKLLNQGA